MHALSPHIIVRELSRLEYNFLLAAGKTPSGYRDIVWSISGDNKIFLDGDELELDAPNNIYDSLDNFSQKYLVPLAWRRVIEQIDPAVLTYWARYA